MSKHIAAIQYGTYTDEQLLEIAVVEVNESDGFTLMGTPKPNGLYDQRMGPVERISILAYAGAIEQAQAMSDNPYILCDPINAESEEAQVPSLVSYTKDQKRSIEKRIDTILNGLSTQYGFTVLEKYLEHRRRNPDSLTRSTILRITDRFIKLKTKRKCTHCGLVPYVDYFNYNYRPVIKLYRSRTFYTTVEDEHVAAEKEAAKEKKAAAKKKASKAKKEKKKPAAKKAQDDDDDKEDENDEDAMDVQENEKKNKIVEHEVDEEILEKDPENKTTTGTIAAATAALESSILPTTMIDLVKHLFTNYATLMSYMYGKEASSKMFFMTLVPVVPNRLRPPMLRMGQYYENDMNSCYSQIIMVSKQISTLFSAPDFSYQSDKVKNLLASLQLAVNGLFDDKMAEMSVRDKSKFPGIKNKIEKKYGYLRWNVMGKRVNFAARSVILPDPYVATNEVSVPRFFAMRLSYPEQVTPFNVDKLRALVIAGAKQYPGANMVDTGEGFQTDLTSLSSTRRLALAKSLQPNHRVLRHVQDGDPLLLNRQPTLHRPSVMAVKARVLNDQKVIRFHYANCKSFNADFDGDEMNLHLPQDALARSEAIHIMDAAKQYISPTSGEPLRGLIQDHIVSGVLLTQKDTYLTREEYQWLVFGCLYEFAGKNDKLETLQPCILKPVPLWSGKQVISAILMHNNRNSAGINLDCKAKCKDALWGAHTEEGTVIIRDNQLLTGVMDKNQFGASAHGLVHACYECYGADNAQRLLTIFTRLTTIFLQYHGFTCGLDDCLLKPSTDEQLMQQFTLANTKNEEATIKFAKEHTSSANTSNNNISETLAQALMNKNNYRKFDSAVKKELNEITSKVIKLSIPSGQYKTFPKNCLTLMTESGAKGSLVNASQISCCLGLQEFEGKRIRHSATGKTLPVFEEFDTSAMAGGYVSGRFLTGITPQEFFFHTMGGREGLIDTAVKTARSGYLQRSMVKMMEGLYTTYDYTVRDTDKSVVQFFYGEDGVDPSKASFMDQFKFLAMNSKALCQKYRIEDVAEAFDVDGSAHKSVNKHMKRLLKRSKGKYNDLSNPIDPVMNRYDPMHHVGSISEKYAMQIADYCKRNPDHMLQSDKDDDDDENDASKLTQDLFKAIAHLKFMRSFAEPGDAVGVLAAQGVGEPSTQMTLNTFHFAGLDMAHVTVGIPRLVELLMTGSIKAPLMSIPASSKCTVAQGEKSAYQLSELKLKDILQQLNISEELLHSNNSYVSVFTVKMKFDTKLLSKVTRVYWERIVKSSLILPLLALLHTQGKASGGVYNFVQKSVQEEMLEQHRKDKNSNDDDEFNDAVEYDDDDENDDNDDENDDNDKTKKKKTKKQRPSTEETASADEIASRMDKYARYLRSCRISESSVELQIEMDYAKNRVFLTQTIERLCEKGFVQKTPGLNKVTLVLDKGKPKDFQVDGLNRDKILHFDMMGTVFDLNKFTTNDVNFLVDTYGVEAGREMIVRELKSVFNSYGIPVDLRHLSLIGDFMTKDGTYQANNRRTATMRTGALSKMSFETASAMLVNSVCTSEYDIMNDPSSRIATGQIMPFGTGIFDLLMAE